MALAGLCEVLFHIDQGNQVDAVFPPGAFSEEELSDIAFCAFPDSMSMELSSRSSVRDSSFCFRLRRRNPPPDAPPHHFLYGRVAGGQALPPDVPLPPPQASLTGTAPWRRHVFCRQRHDDQLRRGCEQRSVVVLSHLPLMAALEGVARAVGPMALSYGPHALQEVYDEVSQGWPPLVWGCRMDLPLPGMQSVRLDLPALSALPSNVLPAAVAAALGRQHDPGQLEGPAAALTAETALAAAAAAAGLATAAAQAGSAAAPPAAAPGSPATPARRPASAALPGSPPPHPATASSAEVAAALADELDGSGLPLCLLPHAYGQQELEASPFGDVDLFTPLRGALPQLWALWELLLLGLPLMVAAPAPGACSAAVVALLSLLAPFPFSLDWRPYFTIHDAAFSRLAAGEAPAAANGLPLVIGLTNLFFLKALPEWPNVVSTGYTAATLLLSSSSDRLDEAASNGSGGSRRSSIGGLPPSESAASVGSSAGSMGGGGLGSKQGGGGGSWLGGTLRRTPGSPAALLSGPVDHCWLAYKPCSKPDKQVLDRLVQPTASDSADKWRRVAAVNSTMLRRHFQELTKALLFPLLPYLSPCQPPRPGATPTADPKAAEAAAAAEPPPLPLFDAAAVLAQLSSKDAILPDLLLQRFGGRKGLLAFYERFLCSPNLAAFMHTRRLAAEEWQRQEWAEAASAAAAPMRELLSVEAFFRIEQQLAAARVQAATACGSGGSDGAEGSEAGTAAAALAEQLEAQLQLAFQDLPSDLRQAILQTPTHAAMLGDVAAVGAQD